MTDPRIPGAHWPPGPASIPAHIRGRGVDVQNGPGDVATARPPAAPDPLAARQQPSQVKIPSARVFQLFGKNLVLPAGAVTIIPFAPL